MSNNFIRLKYLFQGLNRVLVLTLLLLAFSRVSFGTATGAYSMSNCAAGNNYFEFQLNLTNTSTSGEVLYLCIASPIRINHSASIIPAGTNTFTFQYVSGSADPSVAPLYATLGTTYNVAYTASSRLMQVTHSTTVLGNSIAAVNCPIQPGATVSVGKFRLTITNTNFIGGASVGMTWVTTSGFTAYINTATTATNFNTTSNRTLGTPCSMNITSACTAPSLSSIISNPSCSTSNDGSINLTALNGSPAPSFAWSGPNGFSATTEDVSNLSPGTYTVIASSGACSATGNYVVATGPQPSTNVFSAAACDSYTWSANGQTYTQSGSYTFAGTCNNDILNLTISNSSSITTTESATGSYTWTVNGQTYTQSGNYTSVSGCTTEILNLTINTSCTPTQQPSIACYETATWNTITCQWDITGTQPSQPSFACYESATWNGTSCQWDITGTQPSQPSVACYESATWNSTSCQWDITGTQPSQPSVACYESATWNGTSCQWDVTGIQPSQPSVACYESATWNSTSCQWDVTGTPPSPLVTTVSVCDSYTWAQNGQTYTASGIYSTYSNCQDYVLELTISATVTYYADNDGDGFGSNTIISSNCTGLVPSGYTSAAGDCDDNNSSANPGMSELCNAIDDNCDGTIDNATIPLSLGNITGTTTICRSGSAGTASFSVADAGTASCLWTVPSGFIISSGQGSGSIIVSFTGQAMQAGISGLLCVTATDICGSQVSKCVNIDYQIASPTTPPSISGPSKICPGETATYSISSVARAISYNWIPPVGMSITAGQGTNVISVSVSSAFIGGNLGVTASNVCGSSPERVKSLVINPIAAPTAINGAKTGLCNAVGVQYSIAPVSNATSYYWQVTGGGVIASGQGTTSIVVDFPAIVSGSLIVQALNGCGASLQRTLSIFGAPGKPGAISGPLSVCVGDTSTYGIATVDGTDLGGYSWIVTPAGSIISGQGTKTIQVRWLFPSGNQGVNVSASNSCGTSTKNSLSGISATSCLRMTENSVVSGFEIFPNPAQDRTHFRFESESSHSYILRLIDSSGRVVELVKGEAISGMVKGDLFIGTLPNGVYMVELINGDTSVSRMRLAVSHW